MCVRMFIFHLFEKWRSPSHKIRAVAAAAAQQQHENKIHTHTHRQQHHQQIQCMRRSSCILFTDVYVPILILKCVRLKIGQCLRKKRAKQHPCVCVFILMVVYLFCRLFGRFRLIPLHQPLSIPRTPSFGSLTALVYLFILVRSHSAYLSLRVNGWLCTFYTNYYYMFVCLFVSSSVSYESEYTQMRMRPYTITVSILYPGLTFTYSFISYALVLVLCTLSLASCARMCCSKSRSGFLSMRIWW